MMMMLAIVLEYPQLFQKTDSYFTIIGEGSSPNVKLAKIYALQDTNLMRLYGPMYIYLYEYPPIHNHCKKCLRQKNKLKLHILS